ncbi:hypothetical protein C9J85_01300 [Haloferax sp. wsp5]|nr:hypothetical protein C9J85_01300 [Haloferax sp. wsp5]
MGATGDVTWYAAPQRRGVRGGREVQATGRCPVCVEPCLHDFVAGRTDVPVPRIRVYEDNPDADVPPYFVTERIHGENLAEEFAGLSTADRRRVLAQSGRILGDMHSEIGFEAFGRPVSTSVSPVTLLRLQ